MGDEVVYFITNTDDYPGPFATLAEVQKELNYIWDNANSDGWPEGIESVKVYEARVISVATEMDRRNSTDCPVCCGGEVEEEFGEEGCPNCDGVHKVYEDAPTEAWCHGEFDAIITYEMQPPLKGAL